MTAIFKREFRSFFHGMLGYVLTAFLVASSGLYFLARCLIYGLTDFSYYTLYQTIFMLLLYIPVLAMRSLAEERHSRTDQLLLTSPVSVWGIVLGKFFAMAAVFALPCAALPYGCGHDPRPLGAGRHRVCSTRKPCGAALLLFAGLCGRCIV